MDTQRAVEELRRQISQVAENYNRLVLVVGSSNNGSGRVFRALAAASGAAVLNVGIEISKQLLDLTERQRILQLPRLLDEAVANLPRDLSLLDHIEVLFTATLKQDPLRLLQGLSRDRTVVVNWPGAMDGKYLTYAVPEHPEFRKYLITDHSTVCFLPGDIG